MGHSLLILIPLALSCFTHLWNVTGFPDLFYDEGVYVRRAMIVLENQTLQENPYFYDHPPFGQIFLASMLAATGFPDSLNPSVSVESMESLYLIPRLSVGILAVLDTFLIYKISEYRYDNKRIALFASILFAVMPSSWYTRRVLLESLALPFLLTSILFALQLGRSGGTRYLPMLLSGIFLGLSIFTKVPFFTMIPLVGFLVYSGSKSNKLGMIGLWFAPVISVALLWPTSSLLDGSFDNWINGVMAQTQRESEGIYSVFSAFLLVDPVLLILGSIGLGFAALKKDVFILLWAGPFLLFLGLIGYVQYFHLLPILPLFCIASAVWFAKILTKINQRQLVQYGAMAVVGVFGLVCTTLIITTDVTSGQYEAMAFALSISDENTTIVSSPVYSWPYDFVFHMPYAMNDYRDLLYFRIQTEKVVVVSDLHFRGSLKEEPISAIYNSTASVRTFSGDAQNFDFASYPYSSMPLNYQGVAVDVRQREP